MNLLEWSTFLSLECLEVASELTIYIQNSGIVIELSAVVLGRENGDQVFPLSKELVALFNNLVSSNNAV